MSLTLKIAVFALSLAYPFMVYWGLQVVDAQWMLPVLLVVLGLRWITGNKTFERKVVVVTVVGVAAVILLWGYQQGLKFYPVLMNFGLLMLFSSSLFASQTIVERLARLTEPDLPEEGVIYTRKVTIVWCVFFLLNGSVSAVTAIWSSDEIWMLYNGFIAYLLIGLVAGVEWLVRQRVRRG